MSTGRGPAFVGNPRHPRGLLPRLAHMKLLAGVATAFTLFVTSVTTAHAANFVTTLPESITTTTSQTIPFTITADSEICEVYSWSGARVTQSPVGYELEVDPERIGPGTDVVIVNIDYCDGYSDGVAVPITIPYLVTASQVVAPDAEIPFQRQMTIDVSVGDAGPVDVTVLRNGRVVKAFPAQVRTGELTVPVPRKKAKGTWEVIATGAGMTTRIPVEMARGWAPLLANRVLAYPACSTVTWTYEPKGAPRGAANIEKDIRTALRLAEKATGLRFKEVPAGAPAQLVVDWAKLGKGGSDGRGGMAYTGGENPSLSSSVTLNSQSQWVTQPGFGRSSYGVPNRGALILHEVGHALGLGHVTTDADLMYPVSRRGSPTRFTAGDKRGLAYLYQPGTCSN